MPSHRFEKNKSSEAAFTQNRPTDTSKESLPPSIQANNNGSIQNVQDLVSYLEKSKKLLLLYALKNDVSIESFESGKISLTASEKLAPDFIPNLRKILKEATNATWDINMTYGMLNQTLADIENNKKEEDKRKISEYPLVRTILQEFKGVKFDTILRTSEKREDDTLEQELINNFEEED